MVTALGVSMRGRRKNFTPSDDALIRQQPVTGIDVKRLAQILRTNQRRSDTETPNLAFRWSLVLKATALSTRERSAARMDSLTRY
jgi:hypothetical protein